MCAKPIRIQSYISSENYHMEVLYCLLNISEKISMMYIHYQLEILQASLSEKL